MGPHGVLGWKSLEQGMGERGFEMNGVGVWKGLEIGVGVRRVWLLVEGGRG
jgi:hypothetical protein